MVVIFIRSWSLRERVRNLLRIETTAIIFELLRTRISFSSPLRERESSSLFVIYSFPLRFFRITMWTTLLTKITEESTRVSTRIFAGLIVNMLVIFLSWERKPASYFLVSCNVFIYYFYSLNG